MPTIADHIKQLRSYPPEMHAAMDLWLPQDVLDQAEANDVVITEEQADDIIDQVDHNKDATIGINWDVLDYYIDEVRHG